MLLSLCFDFLLFYEHEGVLLQSLILVSTVAVLWPFPLFFPLKTHSFSVLR